MNIHSRAFSILCELIFARLNFYTQYLKPCNSERNFILELFGLSLLLFLSLSFSYSLTLTLFDALRNHACAALIYNAREIFIQGSGGHRFPPLVSALRHFSYSVCVLISLTSSLSRRKRVARAKFNSGTPVPAPGYASRPTIYNDTEPARCARVFA